MEGTKMDITKARDAVEMAEMCLEAARKRINAADAPDYEGMVMLHWAVDSIKLAKKKVENDRSFGDLV